ncbi:MAG: ferritin family protein [Methanomicrobiales archaeon]|nr:ferritin family protein [Methanomicrobiales archaeon]
MNAEDAKKIIAAAIESEQEARSFYQSVAEKVKDPVLKTLFENLAREEKSHREFLQEFLSRDVSTMHFDRSHEFRTSPDIPAPPLSPGMRPVEGLVIAIKKELEAVQLYSQLAELSRDPEQKNLFLRLADMEKTHKTRLEEVYTEMAFPASW